MLIFPKEVIHVEQDSSSERDIPNKVTREDFKVGLSYNSQLLTFSTDSFNFFSADLIRRVICKTAIIIEILQQIKNF